MTQHTASEPSLEFVIPYYGDAGYLREAVSSVLNQTDRAWMLTIVEDGDQASDVGAWLRGLRDPRIRHLRNQRTLGVAANFQRCLDEASENYVAFLGCDDRLRPTYVETIRGAIRRTPSASMFHPGVQVIDEEGHPTSPLGDRVKRHLAPHSGSSAVLSGERLLASLMLGNWTYFPSIAWRREPLRHVGFRQDLDVALDLVALSSLVLDGASLVLFNDVVFEYRRHLGSASSLAATSASRFVEERRAMRDIARRAQEVGWRRAALAARFRLTSRAHAAALFPEAIRSGNWGTATKYLRHLLGS